MDLIADIGATNTRAALVAADGSITAPANFANAEFADLESVLRRYLRDRQLTAPPQRTALAIAAPLAGDEVTMTNIGWRFSQSALCRALGSGELKALNDFEALALALPLLGPGDSQPIGAGAPLPGAALAVLGPGSGLGVAAIVPHEDAWVAVRGEGGHVSLPALAPDEAVVIAAAADATGHCSAETLLSGPGLVRIHSALARHAGQDSAAPTPADITAAAEAGETLAVRTFDVFFSLLGTVAGNLALTVGARGGVFIGGGIVPRVAGMLERSSFRERFIAKGRYRGYLDAIPTRLITCENPAFVGLKASLGYR